MTLRTLRDEWPAITWVGVGETRYDVSLRGRDGVVYPARWAGVLGVGRGYERVVMLVVVARVGDGWYAAVLHHGRSAGCHGRTAREAARRLRGDLRACLCELARQIAATGTPSAPWVLAELRTLMAVAP